MENQDSNVSPAAATEEVAAAAATKNGGNATQEVSSTTKAVEPTKRSLRKQTWHQMRENRFSSRIPSIQNRIPGFINNNKAGELLAETEEFKKANNIRVEIEGPLYSPKLQTLLANKNLYLPAIRNTKCLFLKVNVQGDVTEAEISQLLNLMDVEKNRTEISLADKVELDMVVIGSVVVSREGYRIGRGNGFCDLHMGILSEVGAITDKTVIATLVHDSQVVDTLPAELFQKHDFPVDLIITPTQVIRVEKRLTRPAGIFWELLTERHLKIIPVLQEIKENQEKDGKVIVIKEEDTDAEQNQRNNNRRRFMGRRRFVYRRYRRRTVSQNNTDQPGDENNGQQQRRNPSQRKQFPNQRRRPTKSEGEADDKSVKRRQRPRKNRMVRDFSIKLSNITRSVRIRDLKNELRTRQCKPMALTWKGQYGHCYLHFGHRNGQPTSEDEVNRVLEALNDLSLTITPSSYEKGNKTGAASTNGEGDGAAGEGAGAAGEGAGAAGEGAGAAGEGDATAGDNGEPAEQKADADSASPQSPKVINLKVELLKRADKAKRPDATAGAGGTVNGGEDPASGGDASAARIESVDTTTV